MARKWTAEQQSAIDTRDRTLLVSAAAGSGKTATLTERIIQSILDDKECGDIGKMLIVTFTNAAVNELRLRIGSAISDAAKAHPESSRLEEQLLKVKDARIITINSFCNDVLRLCAESIGISPAYRIAEPAEAGVISTSILVAMINSAFDNKLTEVCSAEDFAEMAEGLTSIKNEDELHLAFTLIYDKLSSEERGLDIFSELCEKYNPEKTGDPLDTDFYRYILNKLYGMSDYYKATLSDFLRDMEAEGAEKKALSVFREAIEITDSLKSCRDYASLHRYMANVTFSDLKNTAAPTYSIAKIYRNEFKKEFCSFREEYFSLSLDNIKNLYAKLYKNTNILSRFLKYFDKLFLEEKKRRSIVEFRDAERYACRALIGEDGSITPLAKEFGDRFSNIYIDEYQDVNGLQGKIFEAISRCDNCFMVGDIKQSIYGFRSARPDFFAGKKSSFPPLGTTGDYPAASIFMSKNFRCDEPIIDFTNDIFDALFQHLGASIGYVPADRLTFAKQYDTESGEAPTGHIPEVHLIEFPKRKPSSDDTDSGEEFAEAAEQDEINSAKCQAMAVAELISSLVGKERLANGQLIRPGDIAVLMRSVISSEKIYADAIGQAGYDVELTSDSDFFLNEEVLLALSLLNVIDNPRRDVHLTALMTSPLWGFTFDELLLFKKAAPELTLWEGVCLYCEKFPEYSSGHKFISAIQRYRSIAESMSVDMLISYIFNESGLLALAEANGGKENLILLHGYAAKYECSSLAGLYSFISYINNIIENNGKIDTASESETHDMDKVKIITSHRSKGLEFPVTIFAEANKRIHVAERGVGARIRLASDFGFSMNVRDKSGVALLSNPIMSIIGEYNKEKVYEESLRVLYVTLTRARERLYVFGSVDNIERFTEKCRLKKEYLSRYSAGEMASFLEMIVTVGTYGKIVHHPYTVAKEPGNAAEHNFAEACGENTQSTDRTGSAYTEKNDVSQSFGEKSLDGDGEGINRANSQELHNASSAGTAGADYALDGEALRDEYIKRLTYTYHTPYLLGVPEKLSVSRLTPRILDGTDIGEEDSGLELDAIISKYSPIYDGGQSSAVQDELDTPRPILPKFKTGNAAEESARRGIATHVFMQFFDLEGLRLHGAEAELHRLIELEFISPEDGKRVRLSEIEKFRTSALFEEMSHASKLYRELRFNILLPADKFTADPARREALRGRELLVQGVIDCIIEDESGELHLVDYKTDRLTRAELASPALAREKMISAHALQLSYYKEAINKIFGKYPKKTGIYSLHAREEFLL